MLARFATYFLSAVDATKKAPSVPTSPSKSKTKPLTPPPAAEESDDSDDSDDDGDAEVVALKDLKKKKMHEPMQAQLQMDVDMHPGATRGEQIIYLSACIFLGRHATREECAGGKYGEHPVSSPLIRKNSKITSLGMQAISAAFVSARRSGSLAPLTSFFTGTRDKMIRAPDDHCDYAQMGAHRIGQWFDTAVQVAASDAVAIEYLELSVVHYSLNGRGLPEEYDGKLMGRAKRIVVDTGFSSPGSTTCSNDSSVATLPRSISSSNTGSVKSDEANNQLGEKMDTVLKGVETMSASLTTMGKRLDGTNSKIDNCKSSCDSLSSRVKALEGKGGGGGGGAQMTKEEKDKTIKCNKCDEIGHRGADCPN
jgi:hypothetical protein